MSVDSLSFPRVLVLNQAGTARVWSGQAVPAAKNSMHSILLVIPKSDKDKPGTETAWRSVVPGLQQRASQAKGIKTLYESCWLIPAEENGLSFFNHAITTAKGSRLHCRVCLLGATQNGFVHRSPNTRLERLRGTAVHIFQGVFGPVLKLLSA